MPDRSASIGGWRGSPQHMPASVYRAAVVSVAFEEAGDWREVRMAPSSSPLMINASPISPPYCRLRNHRMAPASDCPVDPREATPSLPRKIWP